MPAVIQESTTKVVIFPPYCDAPGVILIAPTAIVDEFLFLGWVGGGVGEERERGVSMVT